MKRILAIALAMLLLLTTGCKPAQSTSPTAGSSETGFSGITVEVTQLRTTEKGTELTVLWRNDTVHSAMFGASYQLERLVGDQWVSCVRKEEPVFEAIGYSLDSQQTQTRAYFPDTYFDISQPGTYRFISHCYVYADSEQGQRCQLSATFAVPGKAAGLSYGVQYIRTDGYQENVGFPQVFVIDSTQALKDYYNTWHTVYYLERRDKVYADSTIGFLDACDGYDEAFFQENQLILVLLEEGSGSIRHQVTDVTQAGHQLSVSIESEVPEVVTDDMAQWHLLVALDRTTLPETPTDILVYVDDALRYSTSQANQHTAEASAFGYCGNTWTTLHIGQQDYRFMYGYSVTLTDILRNLNYDPQKLCRCLPEYTVDTEFGSGYGINLTQGYARCEQGQADLTPAQIETIAQIVHWAETTNCRYPLDN